MQVPPSGHAAPQLPQLFESTESAAQLPLQHAPRPPSKGAQAVPINAFGSQVVGTQVPPWHSDPVGHTVPQVPQLSGSDQIKRQAPVQQAPWKAEVRQVSAVNAPVQAPS
jgi:hypothetical protein